MGKIKYLKEKTLETIKKEGFQSLGKKTINYVKLMAIEHSKYQYVYGDILFIDGCDSSLSSRYRVDHQIEQLMSSGLYCQKVLSSDLSLDMMKYFRSFIFIRCPITDTIKDFISLAKANNKIVFFDTDNSISDKEHDATLQLCDYVITPTERLAIELKKYNKEVYINRNVASDRMTELSIKAYENREEHTDIVMGYLSSITYDNDWKLIKPTIIKLMKKYNFLKLKLIGDIRIEEEFKKFQDRIMIEPFMNWEKLPTFIASLDIQLVPLEETIFNETESENRWIEAALCHVVTVASNVGAFKQEIKNGEDGFLCNNEQEWESILTELIEEKELRKRVGNNAYNRVIRNNITIYSGHAFAKYIRSKLTRNIAFVLPSTNVSGGVNVVMRHINILKKRGYDAFVINMDNNEKDIDTGLGKVYVIKQNKTNIAGCIDTLVATLWTTLYFVKNVPNVKNRMYLVQGYETDFAPYGQSMRLRANATYEDTTSIKYLTISKWCQSWLEEKYEKEVRYAPNGIDLKQFEYKKREFTGKIKILVEGNCEEFYKNVDESFRIVEKLDKEKFEIHFLSYQDKTKSWYQIDKFLHKVPYKDVGKIYQDADILIKSSILESFSYPPLEMMATGGLVVVAPNVGNVEYLKDEENCLFYKLGNIDDAVEKINHLLSDEILRERLIKNGLETAQTRDWNTIEKEIVKLYN